MSSSSRQHEPPAELYRQFLAEGAAPLLRTRGYARRGARFSARRGENTLFVQFQRRGVFVAADVGVISALLLGQYGPTPPEHFRVRVGSIAVGWDKWWSLDEWPEKTPELSTDLTKALDAVEPLGRDEGLRDHWLRQSLVSGELAGPEQDWAVLLLRALGPPEWLSDFSVTR